MVTVAASVVAVVVVGVVVMMSLNRKVGEASTTKIVQAEDGSWSEKGEVGCRRCD